MDQLRKNSADHKQTPFASPLVPSGLDSTPSRIDKSQLAFAEPKRLRDKAHLKFVASQPCLVCGRQPSDPHHLRFAQPRALGMKVSDEFAEAITGSCIKPATKSPGGKTYTSMRLRSPRIFGSKLIQNMGVLIHRLNQ
jgi:hypothetical protein